MAFIEASLDELPVRADLGRSCLATKISAPGLSSFGWFRHIGIANLQHEKDLGILLTVGPGGLNLGRAA